MFFIKLLQLRRFQKRRIPAEDHDRTGKVLQCVRRLQHCMSGTQLFRLQGNPRPVAHQRAHQFRAVPDDDHIIAAAGRFRRVHHMLQHGVSAYLMQYLG